MAGPAWAGPPYVTDDPEPTDLGRWEVYAFASGSRISGETTGAAGLDLNFGAAKDLQLTLVLPAEFEHTGHTHWGAGDVEVAAKYKFLHQQDGAATPDVAFFPRLFLPTAGHRFGTGRAGLLLPLWVGKDAGPWAVFGGGGYQLNPGEGARNFWTGGLAVTREVSERLSLGAEVFHQTRDADDALPYTAVNLGVTWKLTGHWSLIGSAGPGIQNAGNGGRANAYIALKADY